jgi:hypothetical protein
MSITLIKQPNGFHSSLNTNWWSFESNMRFAPRFNIRATIRDGSVIYNTLLLPTSPNNLSVLDIKNVMRDYVLPDFNCFITNPTQSKSFKTYKIDLQETFEGLWIFGTSSGGKLGTVSVVNNNYLTSFATPSTVSDIDFVGGNVTSPEVWAINYGTASNGYVNYINLSTNSNTFIPVTASIGNNSSGYMILSNYNIYTNAATFSTDSKRAILANIDYLDYNESNNFDGYIMGQSTSKFLTNSPRTQPIQANEYSTLTFLMSTTQSIHSVLYTDNLGATFSKSLIGLSQSIKVDIPTGTANLTQLNPNAKSYCVQLQKTHNIPQWASAEFLVTDSGGNWEITNNYNIIWGSYNFIIFADPTTYPSPISLYNNVILYSYNEVTNSLIKNDYNISFTGDNASLTFTLTAKNPGSNFNFTNLNISGGANLFSLATTSGNAIIGLTASSEKFCYEIKCLRSFTDSIRLAWLNRLGGIDYWTFRFIESNNIRLVRNNYNKNLNYGSTKRDRSLSTYKLDYYNEWTVVSDILDDETSEWLAELATSTEVYWIRGAELIPITIIGFDYSWNTGFENREARFNFRLSRTNYK